MSRGKRGGDARGAEKLARGAENIRARIPKRKGNQMLVPTIVMAALAAILLAIAIHKGGGLHVQGLKIGLNLTWQVIPLLLCAFTVAGLVQVLVPREMIAQWVGTESGARGIFIGALVGGFAPGGPYVSLPIVAALLKAGAGTGTMVLTAWSLWAFARLPMEVGILGWKFVVIRLISILIFPPIAGFIAVVVEKAMRW